MPARGLPVVPTDAAAEFSHRIVPEVRSAMRAGDAPICILFDTADYTHRAWRLAAVQSLAREAAPRRVNAIAGADNSAVDAAVHYLDAAPGVTGQYLPLDGRGAGDPLS